MHRLGCTGFFLSGILLEFRMFFCIIEEESTQDNTQDNSYTGNVFMENSHNEPKYIEVRGACVHNLKNVNVNVPLHQIVGIAGVSGSGKSSLALGVLYAEGSRRYLESLSTYTRRRMTRAAKAQVDEVLYVPAALALHPQHVWNGNRTVKQPAADVFAARVAPVPERALCSVDTESCGRTGDHLSGVRRTCPCAECGAACL